MKPKVISHTFYFNSLYLGKTLDVLPRIKRCLWLGLVRGEALLFAQQNPVIQEGDCLLAIAFDHALVPFVKVALSRTQRFSTLGLSLFTILS
jgi:Trk K+ transport system NAD-binding subunit